MADNMKFEILADSIKSINVKAGNAAKSAVNQLMTLRNWAITQLYLRRVGSFILFTRIYSTSQT